MCQQEEAQPIEKEKRVQIFSNLAHQYKVATKLAREQETNTYTEEINGYDQERIYLTDDLFAGRLWRLGLLRKFVTNSENVYVPRVLEDLQGFFKSKDGRVAKKDRQEIRSLIDEFNEAIGDRGLIEFPGQSKQSYRDVMMDMIYGVVLHADAARYERLYQDAESPIRWTSVIIWLERVERSLFRVMEYIDGHSEIPIDGKRHHWPWYPQVTS